MDEEKREREKDRPLLSSDCCTLEINSTLRADSPRYWKHPSHEREVWGIEDSKNQVGLFGREQSVRESTPRQSSCRIHICIGHGTAIFLDSALSIHVT